MILSRCKRQRYLEELRNPLWQTSEIYHGKVSIDPGTQIRTGYSIPTTRCDRQFPRSSYHATGKAAQLHIVRFESVCKLLTVNWELLRASVLMKSVISLNVIRETAMKGWRYSYCCLESHGTCDQQGCNHCRNPQAQNAITPVEHAFECRNDRCLRAVWRRIGRGDK